MSFETDAPWAMNKLIADFGFSVEDAAAIMGNAGHESNGFKTLQEIKPVVPGSAGGYGWFQWTGPRRRLFEAYCSRNSLDKNSREANYAFLFVELTGSEKGAVAKTKAAVGLQAKTKAFEMAFERAGVKHYPSRYQWAEKALKAYNASTVPVEPTVATTPAEIRLNPWVTLLIVLWNKLRGR